MKNKTNFSEYPIMVRESNPERRTSMMGFRFFVSMRDHMDSIKVVAQ